MILGLCERFGCLPSALYAEDAGLLRLVAIETAATPAQIPDVGEAVMPDGW